MYNEKFIPNEGELKKFQGRRMINFEYFAERSLERYLNSFGLTVGELEQRTILDIGPSFSFQHEAKKYGIKVLGVDISTRKDYEKGDNLVHGSSQFLPFENDSFDYVISNEAIPLHLRGNDLDALLSIFQMIRVTKKTSQNLSLYSKSNF